MLNSKRIQNRILQLMYRPKQKSTLPLGALDFLKDLDEVIEEKITPLLAEILGEE